MLTPGRELPAPVSVVLHLLRCDGGTQAIRDRLYDKCIPEPNSGCWLWEWGVCKDGYGKFQITNHGPGPKQFHVRAHRLSHFLATGEWPEVVRHGCDNPSCINPAHLSGGTQAENVADIDRRNRRPLGSAHHSSATTEDVVREIRRMLAEGHGPAYIAKHLGVTRSVVGGIKYGVTWRWLDA